MNYKYQTVDRIPKQLNEGIVYHNNDFELAALLCPCGCGHRITLLVPDSHQISSDKGLPSIYPSIAVCDAPCKSHFFIRQGRIDWMNAFSQAEASAVMRGQIARHASHNPQPLSWIGQIWQTIVRVLNRLRAFFGL